MMRRFLLLILIALFGQPALAGYDEGILALQRGDYETAFKELVQLAEAGDSASSWIVASLYRDGTGVKRDKGQAFRFMRQAAEGGHPYGMTDLAVMYAGGVGVTRDKAEARKWLIGAANTKRPEFQLLLGAIYYEGSDLFEIPRSDAEAFHWIELAAEGRVPAAEFLLGVMVGQGRGIAADAEKAMTWYRRAADDGVAEAMSEIGDAYYSGPERRCKDAVKWYRAAADYNLSYAFYRLGRFYETGECVQQDLVQAHFWYLSAWHFGCMGDHKIALKHYGQIERQMTQEQIHEADRLFREWKGKGSPTFVRTGVMNFRLYPFPYVTLPKPNCGWGETVE